MCCRETDFGRILRSTETKCSDSDSIQTVYFPALTSRSVSICSGAWMYCSHLVQVAKRRMWQCCLSDVTKRERAQSFRTHLVDTVFLYFGGRSLLSTPHCCQNHLWDSSRKWDLWNDRPRATKLLIPRSYFWQPLIEGTPGTAIVVACEGAVRLWWTASFGKSTFAKTFYHWRWRL